MLQDFQDALGVIYEARSQICQTKFPERLLQEKLSGAEQRGIEESWSNTEAYLCLLVFFFNQVHL